MGVTASLMRSFNNRFTVEITTTLGCPVDCLYCPQELLKKEGKGRKKKLEYEDFQKAIDNIDVNAEIGWTGYSEASLSPHLDAMVTYAAKKNFDQYISTTLGGCNQSVEFLIKSKHFRRFTLHMPDNSGLMSGINVDEAYVDKVRRCLIQKHKDGLAPTVRILTLGKDLHPLIKDVVQTIYKLDGFQLKYISVGNRVYSRIGYLDDKKIEDLGLRVDDRSSKGIPGNFFCASKKMNSPVLLPDGELSICSFDYGLRMTYGNLFKQKLSVIRKQWIPEIIEEFTNGTFSPCTECEQYWSY